MPLLTGQSVAGLPNRTYSIWVPDNPSAATAPAIIVFHGGGQDAATIAARWGVDPPNPIPLELADYLLVFPESDPRLGAEWVHFQAGDSAFPTLDLEFVRVIARRDHHPAVHHRNSGRHGHRRRRPDLRCRLLQRWRNGLAAAELVAGPQLSRVRCRREGPGPGEGQALPERTDRGRHRHRAGSRSPTSRAPPTAVTGRRSPSTRPTSA